MALDSFKNLKTAREWVQGKVKEQGIYNASVSVLFNGDVTVRGVGVKKLNIALF